MQKVIGASLVAIAALATSAAIAMESVNEDHQEALIALWGGVAQGNATAQTSVGDAGEPNFAGDRSVRRDRFDRQDLTDHQLRWLRGTQAEPADR